MNTQTSANTGPTAVEISVTEDPLGTPAYFNGTNFGGGSEQWFSYTGGSLASWTYNSANLNLTNDKQYRVRARTTDLAANGPTIQSVIFTYDIEKPTSTITNLVSGYVGSLTIVAGTATDDPSGALQYESKLGTSTIGVAIYSVTDGQWWDSDLVDFQSAVPIYYEVVNATGTSLEQLELHVPRAARGKLCGRAVVPVCAAGGGLGGERGVRIECGAGGGGGDGDAG